MRIFLMFFITFSVTSTFAQGVFDDVTKKLGQCYTRTYEKGHLAEKSEQTVTHISAKVYQKPFLFDGETVYSPYLKIQAKRRFKSGKQDKKVYGVDMLCHLGNVDSEKGIYCAVDTCDGPGVYLRYSQVTSGSLLIDNSEFRLTLEPLTCDDSETTEAANIVFSPVKGGDDIFRVDPVEDFNCL